MRERSAARRVIIASPCGGPGAGAGAGAAAGASGVRSTCCDSSSAVSSTSAANSVMELRRLPATLPKRLKNLCALSAMAPRGPQGPLPCLQSSPFELAKLLGRFWRGLQPCPKPCQSNSTPGLSPEVTGCHRRTVGRWTARQYGRFSDGRGVRGGDRGVGAAGRCVNSGMLCGGAQCDVMRVGGSLTAGRCSSERTRYVPRWLAPVPASCIGRLRTRRLVRLEHLRVRGTLGVCVQARRPDCSACCARQATVLMPPSSACATARSWTRTAQSSRSPATTRGRWAPAWVQRSCRARPAARHLAPARPGRGGPAPACARARSGRRPARPGGGGAPARRPLTHACARAAAGGRGQLCGQPERRDQPVPRRGGEQHDGRAHVRARRRDRLPPAGPGGAGHVQRARVPGVRLRAGPGGALRAEARHLAGQQLGHRQQLGQQVRRAAEVSTSQPACSVRLGCCQHPTRRVPRAPAAPRTGFAGRARGCARGRRGAAAAGLRTRAARRTRTRSTPRRPRARRTWRTCARCCRASTPSTTRRARGPARCMFQGRRGRRASPSAQGLLVRAAPMPPVCAAGRDRPRLLPAAPHVRAGSALHGQRGPRLRAADIQ